VTRAGPTSRQGALAGIGATVAMTVFMLVAERRGWMSELPPTRITRATLDPLPGEPPRGRTLAAASALLHIAVGAGAGVAYGALEDRQLWRGVPAVARGVAFGTAFWVAAYVGLLPAIGLMPRPEHDERRRPASMLMAHWVYGAALALLLRLRVVGDRSDLRLRPLLQRCTSLAAARHLAESMSPPGQDPLHP
jgi:hypothetical protein